MTKKGKGSLLLLRHGQSAWNAKDLFTGWVDISLTSKGIEEALAAGEKLKHHHFDRVYTSTLVRAQLTTMLALSRNEGGKIPCVMHEDKELCEKGRVYNPAAEKTLIPVHIHSELNERAYGQLQGMNKQETKIKYGEEQFVAWRRSYRGQPPGGESLEMTAQRTIPFFKRKILPHILEGENVLISAHGNSLRSIVMYLENLSEDEVVKLEIATGQPLYYLHDNSGWFKQPI